MISSEQIQQLLNAQKNNDFVTMLQIAETLLKIAPQNDFLLHSKAVALCRLNKIDNSIIAYENAILNTISQTEKLNLQLVIL